jgi:hypothetical protein
LIEVNRMQGSRVEEELREPQAKSAGLPPPEAELAGHLQFLVEQGEHLVFSGERRHGAHVADGSSRNLRGKRGSDRRFNLK